MGGLWHRIKVYNYSADWVATVPIGCLVHIPTVKCTLVLYLTDDCLCFFPLAYHFFDVEKKSPVDHLLKAININTVCVPHKLIISN